MNKVEIHLKYMKFKSHVKSIPILFPIIRYIKWRIYRPIYIKFWSLLRNLEYNLKNKGFIKWNQNEIKLLKLKNSHIGESAFIIGNGPSLSIKDLDKLHSKGIFCFAANRINLVFEKTQWRPNCYLALDRQIYRNNDPTVPEVIKANIELYTFGKEAYEGIPKTLKRDNILFFERKTNSYYSPINEFSNNALKYIVDGFTVTYAAMQLAYYMGFKNIYLLGCDCNYSRQVNSNGKVIDTGEKTTYFDKRYDPNNANIGYVKGMYEAYESAKKFSEGKDFKIYNASRGGKLEIFNRVDIDTLLEQF